MVLLVAIGGCARTYKSADLYHDHSHSVEVSGRSHKLVSRAETDKVLFRLSFTEGMLFTFSMWTVEYLEFVVDKKDLKDGRRLSLSDLDAWSVAKAYIKGAGRLKEGEIIIESIGKGRIWVRVYAPQLPSQFHGVFEFEESGSPDPPSIDGWVKDDSTR
jgi:hypothetical protein